MKETEDAFCMAWVTVFQGTSGSPYVVAGVLRSAGVDADITPPFGMYPCGPLRTQYVRVHEDSSWRAREILDAARDSAPKKAPPIGYSSVPLWRKLVATYMLAVRFLAG
jgi:hypothetical protein